MNSLSKSFSILQFICLLTILGCVNSTTYSTYIMMGGDIPPGYFYYSYMKSAYKIHETKLSWGDAKSACESGGARLAIFELSDRIGYIIGQLNLGEDYAWVGITRNDSSSPWIGVDGGEISSSLSWGIPGYTSSGGNCVAIGNLTTKLINSDCSMGKMYVCEIPGERRINNRINF